MWELNCEEGWVPKNWCFSTMVLEKTLRVPWTTRRSNQSFLKEISPGISLEGLMLKLKLQYFGHLMRRVNSLDKTDAGREWGQEEKGTTEDEMAGWHHWLDGHESEWTPGVGDGQGGLACCVSWGRKESDTTERLIWSDLIWFFFLDSQITSDCDWRHEFKRCLLLGRKAITNLDSIFKSRDITLPRKVHLVKAMVFPLVMYEYESWTIKKAKCWRIDAFEMWHWRRLLRVPWTAKRSNQSILKEISPGCSLEGLMLKLQYFGYLMQRTGSLEKTLMLWKNEGRRRRGW